MLNAPPMMLKCTPLEITFTSLLPLLLAPEA